MAPVSDPLSLHDALPISAAGRREDAREALESGLKFARRDVRLTIAMNKLTQRRSPVFSFLSRRHPLNRRSEEHTSELQSLRQLVCRLLLEKKNRNLTG